MVGLGSTRLRLPTPANRNSNVWLKLDNLQPSGSFKSRGIGNLMRNAAASTSRQMHFYSSSGGNAGLACACAAVSLAAPCTIVVPEPTKPMMIEKMRELGATVVQTGSSWFEADAYLRAELLVKDPAGVYVPPFDHPDIWTGAATLVDELVDDLVDESVDVHAIVCAVGGGGLLNGLVRGIEKHAAAGIWRGSVPSIVAVETLGAESLNASVRAGEHVTLPAITSIATSLGAVRVCNQTWEYMQRSLPRVSSGTSGVVQASGTNEHTNGVNGHTSIDAPSHPEIISVVVSDADAARAVVRFAEDARMIVEVACGAGLAAVYGGSSSSAHGKAARGPESLRGRVGGQMNDDEWAKTNVVVVVCGGSAVSLDMIADYRATYGV